MDNPNTVMKCHSLQGEMGIVMEGRNNHCRCGGYKTGRAIIPCYAENLNMQWLLSLFSVIGSKIIKKRYNNRILPKKTSKNKGCAKNGLLTHLRRKHRL